MIEFQFGKTPYIVTYFKAFQDCCYWHLSVLGGNGAFRINAISSLKSVWSSQTPFLIPKALALIYYSHIVINHTNLILNKKQCP